MTITETALRPSPYPHHPREIAAAVTLPAAAAALVRPEVGDAHRASVVVNTACGALATRMALLVFLADPAAAAGPPSTVRPFDPFSTPTPEVLLGRGRAPDRIRIRTAGDRCVAAWRQWRSESSTSSDRSGVAGALALASWCSWALGSEARAITRARYALDLVPDDALAGVVLRTALAGRRPSWR